MSECLMRMRDLEANGDVQVLWDIDLDVEDGSIVSIVGPNGAGKTTLHLTLSGMVRATCGSITFRGANIMQLAVVR